jgi:hypothetical protein
LLTLTSPQTQEPDQQLVFFLRELLHGARIANAGVETGAKMLGVSITCCTLMRGSKARANAKPLVLLGTGGSFANF